MKLTVVHGLFPFVPANADESWSVDFDCSSGNLAAVADHVESCLKPLNYSEYWIDNPHFGSTRQTFRSYYSPDKLTEVTISPGKKQPGSPPFAYDFNLSIKITTTPNGVLQFAGTTSENGAKVYLEPIR